MSRDPIRIFNAKEIGSSLKEVAAELIQVEEGGIKSQWFHSKKDADLFIWKDRRHNFIKHQIAFFGQIVEWDIYEGLRTGFIVEDETSQEMGSSPIIKYDAEPQKPSVLQGMDIVAAITTLGIRDKKKIIRDYLLFSGLVAKSADDILPLDKNSSPNLTNMVRHFFIKLGLFRKKT